MKEMRLIFPMIAFIGTLAVSTGVVLDGNTFFIYNKQYYFQKLAQWGTGGRNVGTYQKAAIDQLWTLKADPKNKGCYYIKNVKYKGYLIGQWGDYDQGVGVFKGKRADDQMWKFEKKGKYYKIRSCKYKNRVFSKWGSGNGDWGTYKDVNAKNQFWLLKPRFNATVSQSQIWGVDNRQGSKAFVEKKVVTQGLKLTKSSSVSTKRSLEFSLDAVIPSSVPTKIGLKMKSQIKTSLKKSSEKTWSSKSTITFTAPKGKNYRVTQFVVTFKSEIPGDAMALYGSYKVEETTGALPKLKSYT